MKKIRFSKHYILLVLFYFHSICLISQIIDPVKWSANFKMTGKDEGEIIFSAQIDSGYHIYGAYFDEGGPIRTNFTFPSSNEYELKGKLLEIFKPKRKKDPAFNNMEITLFSGTAKFSQKIKLKKQGELKIPVEVEYMACTDETCLPPVRKQIEVSINTTGLSSHISTYKDSLKNIRKDSSINAGMSEKVIENSDSTLSSNTNLQSTHESLWHFFLIAFIAGLAAIFTPCVFPMIPMTVSYFLKKNENGKSNRIHGVLYGIFITLLYGLVGIIVSLTSVGSNFANQLSTHWIPNLIFFLLFIAFALSFLGLFEIVLPSRLINSADSKAEKGGWIGVFFMALTTVLVSFSCTGPIVGALLVEAVGKVAIKPIVGMTLFGLAFSLPFTFFALFPSSLKKLPKSGGWLNEIKVVLGIIILALGLKFLINIDQAYHLNILPRQFVLIVWIILSAITGLYILGKIRMKHDTSVNTLGVFRLLISLFFFYVSLYLFTGLIGKNNLTSISAFLPSDKNSMFYDQPDAKINFNICETPKYSNILSYPAGIQSYFEYNQAIECARKLNKPILINFKAHTCSNCKQMEAKIWSNPTIKKFITENFVVLALYTDEREKLPQPLFINGVMVKTLGEYNLNLEIQMFKTNALPLYAILDTDGNILEGPINTEFDIEKYLKFLQGGLNKFKEK